ncbi:hypothetical protein AB3R30_23870 [Leptolyngbyaceae cyanobacterium UHCC 1019]
MLKVAQRSLPGSKPRSHYKIGARSHYKIGKIGDRYYEEERELSRSKSV